MENFLDKPSVSLWLKDRVLLITGASGFIGKSLLIQLSNLNHPIKKIYLLVRKKKNFTGMSRIERFSESENLNLENIHVIEGDITHPQLNIEEETYQKICSEVDVVFHIAASIAFNNPLSEAININVKGTLHVLEFARKCTHLQVFVHMSTAFSQVLRHGTLVEEKVYPSPRDIQELFSMSPEELEQQEKEILANGWPNTYTWTKSVAEYLVADFTAHFPVVITRPVLVCGAISSPHFGWTSKLELFSIIYSLNKFKIKWFWISPKNNTGNVPLIPVDIVSNGTLLSAWYQANRLKIIYVKSKKLNQIMTYFEQRFWLFETKNLDRIRNSIQDDDERKKFEVYVPQNHNWVHLMKASGENCFRQIFANMKKKEFLLIRQLYRTCFGIHIVIYVCILYFIFVYLSREF